MKTLERRLRRLERTVKPGPKVDEIYLVPVARAPDGGRIEGEPVLFWSREKQLDEIDREQSQA